MCECVCPLGWESSNGITFNNLAHYIFALATTRQCEQKGEKQQKKWLFFIQIFGFIFISFRFFSQNQKIRFKLSNINNVFYLYRTGAPIP